MKRFTNLKDYELRYSAFEYIICLDYLNIEERNQSMTTISICVEEFRRKFSPDLMSHGSITIVN